eukprot:82173-Hanusia_phi.AAC.2
MTVGGLSHSVVSSQLSFHSSCDPAMRPLPSMQEHSALYIETREQSAISHRVFSGFFKTFSRRFSGIFTFALIGCSLVPGRVSAFSVGHGVQSVRSIPFQPHRFKHACLSRAPWSFTKKYARQEISLRVRPETGDQNEYVVGEPGITEGEEEIRQKISQVVEQMMSKSPAAMAPAPFGELPPRLFLDNAEALLNEPIYKNVMYRRLEECSSEEELQLLEVVDEKLLEFKKEQRDLINKAKLEYIIGAALEGPENRALDDGLVDYLDEIVAKAQEEENNSDSKESVLVKMLKVIKDRVVAEIRTRDKPYVKLLASLLRMEDHPEREAFLRGACKIANVSLRRNNSSMDSTEPGRRHSISRIYCRWSTIYGAGLDLFQTCKKRLIFGKHRADWLMDERVEKMKMIAREARGGEHVQEAVGTEFQNLDSPWTRDIFIFKMRFREESWRHARIRKL